MHLDHGEWTTEPPTIMGNAGEWESESDGILTGTEGSATFQIETDTGVSVGEVRFDWDNPAAGANSYRETLSPAATNDNEDGFSAGHKGGGGDNARVTFVLLDGPGGVDSDGNVLRTKTGGLKTGRRDGVIYMINDKAELLWYRHDGRGDGSFTWAPGSGNTVGTGWAPQHIFSGG